MSVTTIGYGSIPVITNLERIFAMFVMTVGAVICDAGITAILTSIISIRDQQSGTNNRRIQCAKRYMSYNMVDKDVQDRIVDYYKYDDTELQNIKEEDILEDLSSTLKCEVLRYFCYEALRSNDLFRGMSDGALSSLIRLMRPYLSIPNENLTIIGENCESVYVLKRGRVSSVDSAGMENLLKIGSVIGHLATESTYREKGLPTNLLEIKVVRAKGFKTKYGLPYATFTYDSSSCRSAVRKTARWKDNLMMKVSDTNECSLQIVIRSLQSGQVDTIMGSNKLSLKKCTNDCRQVSIYDCNGKVSGILYLNLSLRELRSNEMLRTHEKTTTSIGYSHLYSITNYSVEDLHQYLEASKRNDAIDRLRGSFLEHIMHDNLTEKDRVKHSWRRASRPSIHVKKPKYEMRNSQAHRKAIQRPSIAENGKSDSEKDEKSTKRPLLSKLKSIRPGFSKKKSALILPIADENDPEKGVDELPNGDSRKKSWNSSNTVRTKTLAVPSARQMKSHMEKPEIEGLSENDRGWDVLADVNGRSSRLDSRPSRRATVYMEWVSDTTKHI